MVYKIAQGKKNKAAGKAFEDRVYADLEKKDWICSRWMKNVEFSSEVMLSWKQKPSFDKLMKMGEKAIERNTEVNSKDTTKLIPAKPSIRMIPGKGPILVSAWTGFPDFIAYKMYYLNKKLQEVIGVECKTNGTLTKEEKEKCEWLLKSNTFSKILIASKGTKRGEILYNEFQN